MKNVFSKFIDFFREKAKEFPDKRFRNNTSIKMEDIVLSAFSIFHMQSPSFLQFQKNMKNKEGKCNAETLFGIEKIPSDNHIRNMLDNVAPSYLRPMYDEQLKYLKDTKILDSYKYYQYSNSARITVTSSMVLAPASTTTIATSG